LRYLLNSRCPIFNDLRYLFSGLSELRIDLGLSSAILIRPNPRPSFAGLTEATSKDLLPPAVACQSLASGD
jgi:hypothetical protein